MLYKIKYIFLARKLSTEKLKRKKRIVQKLLDQNQGQCLERKLLLVQSHALFQQGKVSQL